MLSLATLIAAFGSSFQYGYNVSALNSPSEVGPASGRGRGTLGVYGTDLGGHRSQALLPTRRPHCHVYHCGVAAASHIPEPVPPGDPVSQVLPLPDVLVCVPGNHMHTHTHMHAPSAPQLPSAKPEGLTPPPLCSGPQLMKQFYNETHHSRTGEFLESVSLTLLWSVTVSMFPFGGFLGSLLVGPLVNKLGR